jgi:DNA-binding NarL/FixJ family response regulator
MAKAMLQVNTGAMNQPVAPSHPRVVHVLIATQSAYIATGLASLLADPGDIDCEIVDTEGDALLAAFDTGPRVVDIVLLDLEPWAVKTLHAVSVIKTRTLPPLVLALAHGVNETMRHQCRRYGVDQLLDRTADLGRLQGAVASFVRTHNSLPRPGTVAP